MGRLKNRYRQAKRWAGRQTDGQTVKQMDSQTDGQTDGQADKQVVRQTNRWTDRQTDVWKDNLIRSFLVKFQDLALTQSRNKWTWVTCLAGLVSVCCPLTTAHFLSKNRLFSISTKTGERHDTHHNDFQLSQTQTTCCQNCQFKKWQID
jgi:hypothetical protein